jgi:hypothetical protein
MSLVGFEALTAVVLKVTIFWGTVCCCPCMNQRFGRTYYLHLQCRKSPKAICFSETLVHVQNTRRYIPEDGVWCHLVWWFPSVLLSDGRKYSFVAVEIVDEISDKMWLRCVGRCATWHWHIYAFMSYSTEMKTAARNCATEAEADWSACIALEMQHSAFCLLSEFLIHKSELQKRTLLSLKSEADRLCGLVVRVPATDSEVWFDSWRYQIFWEVVGLERGPISLMSTIEELLRRKNSDSGLESREYGRRDPSRWQRRTLYPQTLELTSLTSGGRSVGIVRLQTQSTEFSCFFLSPVTGGGL